jgi:predicted Zn-dependent protease
MSKRRQKSSESVKKSIPVAASGGNRYAILVTGAGILILSVVIYFVSARSNPEKKLRRLIDQYSKSNQFADVESSWKELALVKPDCIKPQDQISWATAALRADHPGAAFEVLEAWKESNPDKPDGWLLILDLARIFGSSDMMMENTNEILNHAMVNRSTAVLLASTLGLLTDLDPLEVRARLNKWSESEQESPLARAYLLLRYAENPLPEDPSRDLRIEQARVLASRYPDSIPVLTALIETLFNGGYYQEATEVLDKWPLDYRTGTAFHRLQGRRLQDVDGKHGEAVGEYEEALKFMPHDWKTRYRLARALAASGKTEESRKEARRMSEIRESLDPIQLGELLKAALPKGRSPEPERLVALLKKIGLKPLADAWVQWWADQKIMNRRK